MLTENWNGICRNGLVSANIEMAGNRFIMQIVNRTFNLLYKARYAKLETCFNIDIPLGLHNADWVVLFELDGQEKPYFVVESKGVIFKYMLCDVEQTKIHCCHERFKDLVEEARYMVASNYENFVDQAMSERR